MAVFLSVLSVIWLVLKWILLILAGIIGLVLVIILIVLLMPLSYKIEADRKEYPDASEEEKEKLILGGSLEAHVRVYWFLRLIRVKLDFAEKKLSWSAKVAWKKLAGSEEEIPEEKEELTEPEPTPEEPEAITAENPEEKKPEKKPEEKTEPVAEEKPKEPEEPGASQEEKPAEAGPQEEKFTEAKPKEEGPVEVKPQEEPVKPAEPESAEAKAETAQEQPEAETAEEEPAVEEEPLEEGPSKLDQILDKTDWVIDKLCDLPDKVDESFEKKLEPVILFWNKLDNFKDKDKALKAVLKLVKREIRPLLPKRVKADIDWGTGDPYLTSKIDGYRIMLADFLFPKKNRKRSLNSYPDHMNRRIEFSISMSDWFMLGSFIPPIIAALLNIHIWHLIKFVKNLKSQEKDHGKQK
ncbi:MAG: hypothetical protein J5589_00515 [Firmicutes bacterium]|nr:hypothetical protein [Bacillota bacterium]